MATPSSTSTTTTTTNGQPQQPSLIHLDPSHDHSYLSPNFYETRQSSLGHNHHHQDGRISGGGTAVVVAKRSPAAFISHEQQQHHHQRKTVLNGQQNDSHQQQNSRTPLPGTVHIKTEEYDDTVANRNMVVNHHHQPERIQFFSKPAHGHHHHHHTNNNSQTTTAATAEFDDEEFDEEDSNDTQSCSSSSGCSSSSNSMVGSVNRHLSLNQPQQQNVRFQNLPGTVSSTTATTTTSSCGNFLLKNGIGNGGGVSGAISNHHIGGTASGAPVCQYKDLTPKQVKRRLDWDATPDRPMVSKTMTAVNGKPFSVRTFKLSNAMKQSLVASGGCSAVAVAVASAFQANGTTKSHEKLMTTTACSPVVNGNNSSPVQILSTNHHQSPTAIAIVNGPSSKSLTPMVSTIVTANTGSLSNGSASTNSPASPVIFKTPLAPKVASSVASFSNQSPLQQQQQVFLVNKNEEDLSPKTASNLRLTPILASTMVKTPVSADEDDEEMLKPKSKKARVAGNRDIMYHQSPTLSAGASGISNVSVRFSDSPITRTPKSNGIRSRNNSFDYSNPDSPCIYSSPMSNNDVFSSTSLYSTSSAYPRSPSSCSSTDYPTGRKSGRTRSETSLGQLTRKFISLLEESNDGSVNLNSASEFLNVQKRRIYDITNVLEGVGLLHKTSKNNIQWRGGLVDYLSGKDTIQQADQTSHYRNRKPPPLSLLFSQNGSGNKSHHSGKEQMNKPIYELENDENRLDHLIKMAREDLDKIKNSSSSHLYASYIDLRRVPEFKEQTVIGIRPPMDTMLEVSDPSENLQIWLKNSNREIIEVYLCPQTPEDDEPGIQFQDPDVSVGIIRTHERLTDDDNGETPLPSRTRMFNSNDNKMVSNVELVKLDKSDEINNVESGYQSYFESGSITPVLTKLAKQDCVSIGQNADTPNVDIEKTLLNSSPVNDENTEQQQIMVKEEPSSIGEHSSYAHAFIDDVDEFGPHGSRTYISQTQDHILKSSPSCAGAKSLLESPNRFESSHYQQHHSHSSSHPHQHHQNSPISSSPLAWIPMEPVIVSEDYDFNLCDNEGIAELFDDNDLSLNI